MNTEEIGKRLQELRYRMDISHDKMAAESGINRAFLVNVEEGKQNPSYDFICKLIDSYHVSSDWLLTGRGEIFLWPEEHHLYRLDIPTLELLEKLYSLPDERRISMVTAITSVVDLG